MIITILKNASSNLQQDTNILCKLYREQNHITFNNSKTDFVPIIDLFCKWWSSKAHKNLLTNLLFSCLLTWLF